MIRLVRGGVCAAMPIVVVLSSGCANQAQSPPPVVARQVSPELQLARSTAERRYRACLQSAAKFADDGRAAPGDLALVTAPMCYPQFSEYEATLTTGLSEDESRAVVRTGDQMQLEFAKAAIDQERGGTAVAANG